MKTQTKCDALLDAFEKQQLSKIEMSELSGGRSGAVGGDSSVAVKYTTRTGIFIHKINEDGSTQYYNIIGVERTSADLIAMGDNYRV